MTFIYGVTSWCFIRKFRNFNNYVYLSATIVNILRLVIMTIIFNNCGKIVSNVEFVNVYFYIFMFLSTVYHYWLVVLCYGVYVKVFHRDLSRKYLKSSIFAWGFPLVVWLICGLIFIIILSSIGNDDAHLFRRTYIFVCVIVTCNGIPSVFNLVVFIKFSYSLFFSKQTNASTASKKDRCKEKWRRLYIVIFMYFLSNMFILYFHIWKVFDISFLIRIVTTHLQILPVTLFIPLVNSNRNVWNKYFNNRLARNMS